MSFVVKLDQYQGPIDLLIQLVREEEVEILGVMIAEIVRRYSEFLGQSGALDIESVGDFIASASMLMELKARELIPAAPEEEPEAETESKQELVRQLLEYKRFREVAELLHAKARLQHQKLSRLAADLPAPDVSAADRPIRELELWDLVTAFSRLLKETVIPTADRIPIDTTPISTYMDRLRELVALTPGLSFRELLGLQNSRSQLIGKFLALLELVKLKELWIEWGADSDDILVSPWVAERVSQQLPPSLPMEDTAPPPEAVIRRETLLEEDDAEEDFSDLDLPGLAHWEEKPTETKNPERRGWDEFEPLLDDEDREEPTGEPNDDEP